MKANKEKPVSSVRDTPVDGLFHTTTGGLRAPDAVVSAPNDEAEARHEIERLGLLPELYQMETLGYAVITPDKVGSPKFIERLRTKVLDVAERRNGVRPDIVTGGTHANPEIPFGQILWYLMLEDRVFQEALLNPAPLALATYLLGRSCILNSAVALLKGPGGKPLALHADNPLMPSPFPPYACQANIIWTLTDYTVENGCTMFVPASHRYCRPPTPGEGVDSAVPIIAPAGSVIVYPSNTWHGALARKAPGLRMSFQISMMRAFMCPTEPYKQDVTDEIIAQHPPRFARLMGKSLSFPWRAEGIKYETVNPGASWWD